jgi:hypothetical protein
VFSVSVVLAFVITTQIRCLYVDHPTFKAQHRLKLAKTAMNVLRSLLQSTVSIGIVSVRTEAVSQEHGLLLALSTMWRTVASTVPGGVAADVTASVLHLLILCCGDGAFGDFSRQVSSTSEFIGKMLRWISAMPPEKLTVPCLSDGVLGGFCKAAVSVPVLREIVRASGFASFLYRAGAISQPDVFC